MSFDRPHISALLSIGLLGIVLYANTLPNSFTYDDHLQIEENQALRSLPAFARNTSLHRLITKFTWFVDFGLWGLNPVGYHITNLLLHLAASCMLYLLVWQLLGSRWLGLATALLFVAHPVHTESVASIANRHDLLAALFLFSAWALAAERRGGRARSGIALILFALALLSKEVVIAFPLLLILQHRLLPAEGRGESSSGRAGRSPVGSMLVLSAVAMIYAGYKLFLRWDTLGQTWASMGHSLSGGRTYPEILASQLSAVPIYLRLLVAPAGLRADYFFAAHASLAGAGSLLGLALLLGLGAVALASVRRSPITVFSIAWFVLFMLPVSNIVPGAFFVAERYLYIPSAAYCLVLALALHRLRAADAGDRRSARREGIAIALLLLMLCSYGWITISRNREWRDDITFWEAALSENPRSLPARTNLGLVELGRGNFSLAILHLREAARLRPELARTHSNLGAAYGEAGRPDEAVLAFTEAVRLAPDMARFRCNLATAYGASGRTDRAIAELERTVALSPGFVDAHHELGRLYWEAGNLESARRHFALAGRPVPGEPPDDRPNEMGRR